MMTDNEGFVPDCYRDYRESMVEYMAARDNGFDGNYTDFCEMQQGIIKRGQNESALLRAIEALRFAGVTRESIRDMVDEALR